MNTAEAITPDESEQKNPEEAITEDKMKDAEILRELIRTQRESGAIVSEDIDNSLEYDWSGERLTGINWAEKLLSGNIDFSAFTELEKLKLGGNRLTGIDVSNCKKLYTLWCNANQLKDLDIRHCPVLYDLLFDITVTVQGEILTPPEETDT